MGSTLDGSCRTRAPASDGNVEGVCESDDVPKGMRERRTRTHAPSLTAPGRGRASPARSTTCRRFLCETFAVTLSSMRGLSQQRVNASLEDYTRARTPPPCAHDAHLVGRSERCADGARARPVHAPVRAPSARRGRVSAHLESSPRRARVRNPSSRRDRLRPQSAPLRACSGPGRATSLRRAQKPSGPMTQWGFRLRTITHQKPVC